MINFRANQLPIRMRALKPAEAKALLDAGRATLLDVRLPEELELAALPGAVHIPLPEIGQRLGELDKSAPIVVLCHHGARSEMAARLLEKHGFTAVSNLAGGIDAWSQQVDASVPRY